MKLFTVTLLIGLFVSAVLGVNEQDLPRKFEAREYAAVVEGLERMRTENPEGFFGGEFDYLLGRAAEAEQNYPLAMASYQTAAARESVLRPQALRRLAHISRSTGNLLLESLYLREISFLAADSPTGANAESRLAYNSYERGNFAETIRTIRSPRSGAVEESREMRFLLAEALLAAGDAGNARPMLENFVSDAASGSQPDDLALGAVKSLDLMDGGVPDKKAPQVTESEHVRRAGIYQFNREFTRARLHYDAIVANWPQSSNAADALLQIGRGFAQLGDFVESLKWFERLLEIYPQSPSAKDALLQAANAYGRVGRPREGTKRYQTFIDNYPADERVERAYFNIVDTLRDQGSDIEAIRQCEQIQVKFKGKRGEALALFTEARIRLSREEWREAIDILDRLKSHADLGGANVAGSTSHAEVAFLRAIAFEGLKDFGSAIDAHLSIPDGRGEYYGRRSTQRLASLAGDEASRSFVDQTIGRASGQLQATDPDVKQKAARALLRLSSNADVRERAMSILRSTPALMLKASGSQARSPVRDFTAMGTPPTVRRLADLGLYDEAVAEAVTQRRALNSTEQPVSIPVELNERAGRADLIINSAEPQWRSIPADYPVDLLSKEQLRRLYPAAFVDELRQVAGTYKVDPRLILAIMRQESRFQNGAKSNAAARGLMQFIASTATRTAAELDRGNFRQDDLYDPSTAIEFGAKYLQNLFVMFPEQTEAVVASYNGGEDNMKRWLARSRSSRPERYVPEIQYAQSKDYVHKVLASYWMYERLYDERLVPRQ